MLRQLTGFIIIAVALAIAGGLGWVSYRAFVIDGRTPDRGATLVLILFALGIGLLLYYAVRLIRGPNRE